MNRDNNQNQGDQDQGVEIPKDALAKIKREKAQDEIADERQAEVDQYKQRREQEGFDLIDSLRSNLKRWGKDLSYRAKTKKVEEKAENIDLSTEEEKTLKAVYGQLDKEVAELDAVYNQLKDSFITKLINNKWAKKGTVVGAIGASIYGFAKSRTIRNGVRTVIGFISSNPLTIGLAGGAIAGGVRGWTKERERVHQAKSWEEESGLPDEVIDPDFDLETAMNLGESQPEQLKKIAGILGNAFSDSKVRDNSARTLRLASKYRIAKEALLRIEEGASADGGNIFDKLDHLEKTDEDIEQTIIGSAGEDYRDDYKEILKGKKRQIYKKAAYGAVFGGVLGALAGSIGGALAEESGPDLQKISPDNFSWADTHEAKTGFGLFKLNESGEPILTQDALNQGFSIENGKLPYGNPEFPVEDITDPNYMEHLKNVQNEWGFGFYNPDAEKYYTNWDEFNKFTDMIEEDNWGYNNGIESTNIEGALQMGWQHNIDLLAPVSQEGQTMAQFLEVNNDWFAGLDPLKKKYLISHPDQAQELLRNGFEQIEQLKNIYSADLIDGEEVGSAFAVIGGIAASWLTSYQATGKIEDRINKGFNLNLRDRISSLFSRFRRNRQEEEAEDETEAEPELENDQPEIETEENIPPSSNDESNAENENITEEPLEAKEIVSAIPDEEEEEED